VWLRDAMQGTRSPSTTGRHRNSWIMRSSAHANGLAGRICADAVDEQQLAELALTATAARLARMISGFRSDADRQSVGERLDQSGVGCSRRWLGFDPIADSVFKALVLAGSSS
jgi:hypothetical protein